MGISGMALFESAGERVSFLVVHDNKKPDQDRAGVVTVEAGKEPTYKRLSWSGEDPPKDLEALAAVPGQKGGYVVGRAKASCAASGWMIRKASR